MCSRSGQERNRERKRHNSVLKDFQGPPLGHPYGIRDPTVSRRFLADCGGVAEAV